MSQEARKLTVNIVSDPHTDQGQTVLDYNGAFFAKVYSTYDAKTIVRAVNSHEALVRALEAIKIGTSHESFVIQKEYVEDLLLTLNDIASSVLKKVKETNGL